MEVLPTEFDDVVRLSIPNPKRVFPHSYLHFNDTEVNSILEDEVDSGFHILKSNCFGDESQLEDNEMSPWNYELNSFSPSSQNNYNIERNTTIRSFSTPAAFSTSTLGHSIAHIPHVSFNADIDRMWTHSQFQNRNGSESFRPNEKKFEQKQQSKIEQKSSIIFGHKEQSWINSCKSAPVDGVHSTVGERRPLSGGSHKRSVNGFISQLQTIEDIVIDCCTSILETSSERSLKAVELANTLRARIGTEMLAMVRENYGGLLALLERHCDVFKVDRIAKNDKVSLWSVGNSHDSLRLPVNFDDWRTTSQTNILDPSHGMQYNVTRCLHVGNVPNSLSERQLSKEFEKYGLLESIKLVSQRNSARRFAFVTFISVADAIYAKQCLSKLHPWKSAISYAHRDGNIGVVSSPYPLDSRSLMPREENANQMNSKHYGFATNDILYSEEPPIDCLKATAEPFITGASYSQLPVSVQSHDMPLAIISHDDALGGVNFSCPILQKLCDDTYVPTQPWNVDSAADLPYCNAVFAQLQYFGGSTTISKLRGFLRGKLCAVDNIKSVPLKALLSAYPDLFVVQSNFVSLHPQFLGGYGLER